MRFNSDDLARLKKACELYKDYTGSEYMWDQYEHLLTKLEQYENEYCLLESPGNVKWFLLVSYMKVKNMTEMEQRIKMRRAFAMSSLARMFTPNRITYEMRDLCHEWSKIEEQPPQGDLYLVDRYFLELWKERNETRN